jgi:DNA-binding NarL/FixJ family response regulator
MTTVLRPDRLLDAVERTCASAESADALLASLSHDLHQAIPHDAAAWFGLDPATMLATAPSRIEGLPAESCEPFWRVEFHEHDLGLYADLARGDGVYSLRRALGDRPAKSARYREVMQPQGYDDELRAVFRAGDRSWGFVGIYRDSARHPFTDDEVEAVRLISAPIAVALRSHIRNLAPALGQPSAPGMLVIDHDDRIVSSNEEGLAWLAELWPSAATGDGLHDLRMHNLRDDLLEVATPLFALVARARAVAMARERVPARLRLRDRRGRWLVLHASVLQSGAKADSSTVALVIEPAKSAEIAPILIDAYSLTTREREVLGAIARGGSTAEVAAALHLSPHTVRDYVKTIFEKFEVSSRGELVGKLFGEHYADPLHATMVHAD